MVLIKNASINWKLRIIALVSSGIALTIAITAMLVIDYQRARKNLTEDISSIADMIGGNSTAALIFDEAEGAEEILSVLKIHRSIIAACIYKSNQERFATYIRGENGEEDTYTFKSKPPPLGHSFSDGLYVTRPIRHGNKNLGTIYIHSDLSKIETRMEQMTNVALIVLGLSLVVAIFLSSIIQRFISRPILHLAQTAETITTDKDYSVRAEKYGNDELGMLVNRFNTMLAEIQTRDTELENARYKLEDRVRRRTAKLTKEIAERKRTEEELIIAKEKAEAASKAKSEFLANMSHEIRTPLNGVLGMMSLTQQTALSGEQRKFLHMAQASAEQLLVVINDILDFSRIEAGKLSMDLIPFNLHELLLNSLKSFALKAEEKGIELICHIRPDIPVAVIGDPNRLRQVLLNLISNAIKFTEKGEVTVRVERQSEADDSVVLKFSVTDTGIGIPPEKQQLIFNSFEQVDGSSTRLYGGVGLGLAISTSLIDLMGGRIYVTSELNQGSTFNFEVEFSRHEGALEVDVPISIESLEGMRVLVVDDNKTNLLILQEMLTNWKMESIAVDSGPKALVEMEQSLARGKGFRLIIVDNQMPSMDGFTLIENVIKMQDSLDTTVMMLSSVDLQLNIGRCRELGIAEYLIKPVTQSDLLNSILIVLGLRTKPLMENSRSEFSPNGLDRNLDILLAEDNHINKELVVGMLERYNHSIFWASNGKNAVAAWQQQRFDLIFMDIQMPEMDGLEATQAIRKQESATGQHIPIIALTAHAMKQDRDMCLNSGMDGYIAKPISEKALLDALTRFCYKKPKAPVQPKGAPQEYAPDILDRKEALVRLGGSGDLLDQIISHFMDYAPTYIENISSSIDLKDIKILRKHAHNLKGIAANISAVAITDIALKIETDAKKGDIEGARSHLIELKQAFVHLEEFLCNAGPTSPA